MFLRLFMTLLIAVGLVLSPIPFAQHEPQGPGGALADDDGGDDGDDGGGTDGGQGASGSGGPSGEGGRVRGNSRSGSGVGLLQRLFPGLTPQRQRTVRRAPPPTPPGFARDEIVALSLDDDDLDALLAQGFAVLEEIDVPGVAAVPRRLSIPGGVDLAQARDIVRALPSGADADFNHFYRTEQGFAENCVGADCPARLMIGWPMPPAREGTCGSSVALGMIDTGINAEHETFEGARLDVERFSPEAVEASRALHGTAVAALLVGHPSSRSPGLVPNARLFAQDAFYRRGGDERADVFTLVRALGRQAEEEVRVLNLSFAGPDNRVLGTVIDRLVRELDMVVVAVGNDGPGAAPSYPAAYEGVIAVTAVDRNGAIYRRAGRGTHVDLAAPGVNVWTAASVSGARWKTGTSFAVPFVTAAVAMLRETRPDLSAAEVGTVLRERAGDLGAPGQDDIFGAGLLNIEGLCDDRS